MKIIELRRLLALGDQWKVVGDGFKGFEATRLDWNGVQLIPSGAESNTSIGFMYQCISEAIGSSIPTTFKPEDDEISARADTIVYYQGAELSVTTVLDWLSLD